MLSVVIMKTAERPSFSGFMKKTKASADNSKYIKSALCVH